MSRTRQILRREKMEMSLGQAIDLFIMAKETEGRSHETTRWYRNMLGRFAHHMPNGLNQTLHSVGLDDARSFVAELQSRDSRYLEHPFLKPREGGLAPTTIHGHVRTLKVFGSWLASEGIVASDPFGKLKRPKLPSPVIKILSEDEMRTLVQAINPNTFLGGVNRRPMYTTRSRLMYTT